MEKVPIPRENSHNNKIFVQNKHLVRQRVEIYIQQFSANNWNTFYGISLMVIERIWRFAVWCAIRQSATGHSTQIKNKRTPFRWHVFGALSAYMRIGQNLLTVECRHRRYWWALLNLFYLPRHRACVCNMCMSNGVHICAQSNHHSVDVMHIKRAKFIVVSISSSIGHIRVWNVNINSSAHMRPIGHRQIIT